MTERIIKWRQGDIIKSEDIHTLQLSDAEISDRRAVVISHDCDLANPKEPFVEMILGNVVVKPDKRSSYSRHPREIHIEYATVGGNIAIELQHANRLSVNKELFLKLDGPDDTFLLPDNQKRSLKQWLAAHYGRPSFPENFEIRLRKKISKKTSVIDEISTIIESVEEHIIGLFFDLGQHRGVELPEGEPYELSIQLVYNTIEGGPAARQHATDVAERLTTLFHNIYGDPFNATEIALNNCTAIADIAFSLADLLKSDQWRLEYLSLRNDPASSFISVGSIAE